MTNRPYGMYLAYFTLAALGFNALLAVYLGFGFGSALVGLLIAVTPFLFTWYTKIKFPWFVYFLICLAVLIHISGYIQGRYLNIPNWDTLAHTVSGSILALLGFILILFMDKIRKYNLDPLSIAAFTVMFGLTGEYLWEIYEFLVDTLPWRLPCRQDAGGQHGYHDGYDLCISSLPHHRNCMLLLREKIQKRNNRARNAQGQYLFPRIIFSEIGHPVKDKRG